MKIVYVQFIHPISVGGKYATINGWDATKHADIGIDIAGNWVTLTIGDGTRRRTPMTNVVYINEKTDEQPVEKKVK